jgi:nucleotide-binding universal stress UspA family protein
LVATDFGETSQDAVKYAFALAETSEATVHLVHVVRPEDALEAVANTREPLQDPEVWAEQKLRRLAEPYTSSGHVGTPFAPVGDPTTEILHVADQVGADLLVIGESGRTRLGRLLRSGVTGRITRRAHCPVTVLGHDRAA